MALRDYLKSQKSLRNNLSDCNVASVETPCDRTIDPLAQQYSGFAADVASVASVTIEREHNSNTNQEHLSQMEKSSSLNDNIYIKSYNKIRKENDSETGTSSAVTVATVATLQHSCGVAGYSRCDTSETVATVENPHNSKGQTEIKILQQKVEQLWQSRTPASFPVPEGYDADQLCRRIEIQFEKWWQEEPETQMMSCMVLPASRNEPFRLNIFRLTLSHDVRGNSSNLNQ